MRVWALASCGGALALATACSSQPANEANAPIPDGPEEDTQVNHRRSSSQVSRDNSAPEAVDSRAELLKARFRQRQAQAQPQSPGTRSQRPGASTPEQIGSNREQIQQRIQALTARARATRSQLPTTTPIPRTAPKPPTISVRQPVQANPPTAAETPAAATAAVAAATAPATPPAASTSAVQSEPVATLPSPEPAVQNTAAAPEPAVSSPAPSSQPLHGGTSSTGEPAHLTEAAYQARVAQILSRAEASGLHGAPTDPAPTAAVDADRERALQDAPAVNPVIRTPIPEAASSPPHITSSVGQTEISRPQFSPQQPQVSVPEAHQLSQPPLAGAEPSLSELPEQLEQSLPALGASATTLSASALADDDENSLKQQCLAADDQLDRASDRISLGTPNSARTGAQAVDLSLREPSKVRSKSFTCWGDTSPLAQRSPEAATAGTPIPGRVESPTRYSPEIGMAAPGNTP